MAIDCDVAIIGAGPGGYVAAIRAAQLGGRVILIEREYAGGTCLNKGCIPSKSFLDSAARYETLRHAADYGFQTGDIGYDFAQVQARKQKTVLQLRSGVEGLVKANGITYLHGSGRFVDAHHLQVALADGGTQDVNARSVVIATGTTEWRPPLPGLDLPGVIDSKEALSLTEIPRSIVIAGGGPIGVEFATVFAAFGAEVTVVEMLPNLLPLEDPDLGRELARQFGRRKIGVRTGSRLEGVRPVDGGLEATIRNDSGTEALRAEMILVALSRAPVTEGLGLDALGVEMNRRFIRVDQRMQTSVPGVYAIGDVVGGGLAHVASMQGEVAVENALGHEAEMDYRAVPSVTFSTPQVASVGLSEEKARATGQPIQVGRFPFAANSKAVVLGETAGFVKVVAESKYGQVLGVHMIGPEVTDLIAEGVLAIMMEATIEDVAATIHAHPTLPEAFKEATLDVVGKAIHIYKRRS